MIFVENYLTFFSSVIVCMLLSMWVAYKITKRAFPSLILILFKFGIFVLYFTLLCHIRSFSMKDDVMYYRNSIILFKKITSIAFFFKEEGWGTLGALAGGQHFGYFIYNVIAFHLFGLAYYAPVLLNVLLSVFSARIFYKTIRLAGGSKEISIFAFAFFLIHWDIITWSSFLDLKDILALHMTMLGLYNLVTIKVKGLKLWPVVSFLLLLFLFQFVRFYFTYMLIITAVVFWVLTQMYKRKSRWTKWYLKLNVFFLLPAGFYIFFNYLFASKLAAIGPKSNIIYGSIRYLLTPVPFKIVPESSFQTVAAILHWAFIPIAIYGCYLFIKRHLEVLMPLLILVLLLTVFYGSFEELQGPRHRVVIINFIALVQVLGLWEIIKILVRSRVVKQQKKIEICHKNE